MRRCSLAGACGLAARFVHVRYIPELDGVVEDTTRGERPSVRPVKMSSRRWTPRSSSWPMLSSMAAARAMSKASANPMCFDRVAWV